MDDASLPASSDAAFLNSNPTIREVMQHPFITRLVYHRLPELIA
jgi:hypothetical protein